ncbi:peptidoglycan editing factor PgeF [Gilvimarinus sp. DA14]|uniref:peptidoglycan editing factor PgeF n=1 Tax=Gilvimarinus sp. DA14 TaxID=2956798 RepID=UPI0020B856BB|nr:peptidoglycan editing factor PgeF [Gilvimarinus sp. DA14]UTF61746.1 peptidoglycan editing factor PgeF [Gilvimarinus sp. DA14]
MTDSFITPQWPAPQTVGAVVTTRKGGNSGGAFASNNLALHVEDSPQAVEANREAMAAHCGWHKQPQWLEQIHGVKVLKAQDDGLVRTADGSYSREMGLPCVVLTADCLPVLLCSKSGDEVAAVHAGWRSLARGIIPRALDKLNAQADDVMAWLGPAIGPEHFEVGVDVLEAFFKHAQSDTHTDAIAAAMRPGLKPMHFYADLYALARASLNACGVTQIYGGDFCTYRDSEQFYSYRRDGKNTGRMATAIWIK